MKGSPTAIIDDFIKNINSTCGNKENSDILGENFTPINELIYDYQKINNDLKRELNDTEAMKKTIKDYENVYNSLELDIDKLINTNSDNNNALDNNTLQLLKNIKNKSSDLCKKNNTVMNYNFIKDDNIQELFNTITSKIIELFQIQYTKNVVVIGIYDESFKHGATELRIDEAINLLSNIKNQKNKSDNEKTIPYIQPTNESVIIESQNMSISNGINTAIVNDINIFSSF